MARNYASIHTGIWRKEDTFTDLTGSAQRTYFLLLTQPDISAAGVLPLTIGRWAAKAKDTTPASIRADIAELAGARYVFCDDVTEELLVRTFVKWDNGYTNPKRRPVIKEAADAIESADLRRVLAAELERLGIAAPGLVSTPNPSPEPPDRPSGSPSDRQSDDSARLDSQALRPAENPSQPSTSWDRTERTADHHNAAYPQVNSLSGCLSGSYPDSQPPSERVVVTKAEYLEPQPPTRKPQPPSPSRDVAATAPPEPAATPTTEGEEGDGQTPEQTLITQIRTKRPEWSARSIARALHDPDVAERPWPVIAAAMRVIAEDPDSRAPGRIRGDGPWWATAARQPTEPTALAPPCGTCDSNRMVLRGDGRMVRCPACHPLRRAS